MGRSADLKTAKTIAELVNDKLKIANSTSDPDSHKSQGYAISMAAVVTLSPKFAKQVHANNEENASKYLSEATGPKTQGKKALEREDGHAVCADFAGAVIHLADTHPFTMEYELVRAGTDTHFFVVVGRGSGDLADVNKWSDDAFVIDVWRHQNSGGPMIIERPKGDEWISSSAGHFKVVESYVPSARPSSPKKKGCLVM